MGSAPGKTALQAREAELLSEDWASYHSFIRSLTHSFIQSVQVTIILGSDDYQQSNENGKKRMTLEKTLKELKELRKLMKGEFIRVGVEAKGDPGGRVRVRPSTQRALEEWRWRRWS